MPQPRQDDMSGKKFDQGEERKGLHRRRRPPGARVGEKEVNPRCNPKSKKGGGITIPFHSRPWLLTFKGRGFAIP